MAGKVQRFVLSGCSGGGKTTLIDALARRGFATFDEPGRRVLARGISPLSEPEAFATACLELAAQDFDDAGPGPNFYDRSLLDAVAFFRRTGRTLPKAYRGVVEAYRYDSPIFMVPPWPENFDGDPGRVLPWAEALAEYDSLLDLLAKAGYETVIVPHSDVAARIDWVLAVLGLET